MNTILFKKALVLTIILLFVCTTTIQISGLSNNTMLTHMLN